MTVKQIESSATNPAAAFKAAHSLTYPQMAALLGWTGRAWQSWALGTRSISQAALQKLEQFQSGPDMNEQVARVKAEVPNLKGKVKPERRRVV